MPRWWYRGFRFSWHPASGHGSSSAAPLRGEHRRNLSHFLRCFHPRLPDLLTPDRILPYKLQEYRYPCRSYMHLPRKGLRLHRSYHPLQRQSCQQWCWLFRYPSGHSDNPPSGSFLLQFQPALSLLRSPRGSCPENHALRTGKCQSCSFPRRLLPGFLLLHSLLCRHSLPAGRPYMQLSKYCLIISFSYSFPSFFASSVSSFSVLFSNILLIEFIISSILGKICPSETKMLIFKKFFEAVLF